MSNNYKDNNSVDSSIKTTKMGFEENTTVEKDMDKKTLEDDDIDLDIDAESDYADEQNTWFSKNRIYAALVIILLVSGILTYFIYPHAWQFTGGGLFGDLGKTTSSNSATSKKSTSSNNVPQDALSFLFGNSKNNANKTTEIKEKKSSTSKQSTQVKPESAQTKITSKSAGAPSKTTKAQTNNSNKNNQTSSNSGNANNAPNQGGQPLAPSALNPQQVEFYRQLGRAIGEMRASITNLTTAVGNLQNDRSALLQDFRLLRQNFAQLVNNTQNHYDVAFFALLNIERSLAKGEGFLLPLEVLQNNLPLDANLASNFITSIKPFAENGVSTDIEILEAFRKIRAQVNANSGETNEADSSFMGWFSGLVKIENLAQTDTATVDGALNSIEQHLINSEISKALEIATKLPPAQQNKLQSWLVEASKRVQVDSTLTEATNALLRANTRNSFGAE